MADRPKENLKHQWKQWIDANTHGFKDKLNEEGRLAYGALYWIYRGKELTEERLTHKKWERYTGVRMFLR